MRRKARVDDNQQEIVAALRQVGCSVISLAPVGGGCPDILCGFQGRNILMELKDGSKSPSRRKLTADQQGFHATWNGQIAVVKNVKEAIRCLRRL